MQDRAVSMASGIMPEAAPVELVEAAAAAGFTHGGMWMEPATWTSETTRAVARRLRDSGLKLLDIEVVWIKPGPLDPDHVRIVEVGVELGAANVLCVSSDPDPVATRDKLVALADVGERCGIKVNLEFGPFTEVKTIHAARAIVSQIASPAIGILVDALHWRRSGGTIADIATLPAEWTHYIQLCDAPLMFAGLGDPLAIITEAIDERLALGEGELPLHDILSAVPSDLPISVEERSKPLRDGWPNLHDRARELKRRCDRYFGR